MPIRTANLMEQVYDLFSKLYAAQSNARSVLAFEVGVPITPDMFRLDASDAAASPGLSNAPVDHPLSPALAIERLSEIANSVLEVTGDSVHRTSRTVDAMVEVLLTQSMPATTDDMALLGAAKDPAAKKFDLKLGSLSGPFQFRPVYATPANWYDPDAKDNWTAHAIGQQNQTTAAPPAARPPIRLTQPTWRVLPVQARPVIRTPTRVMIMTRAQPMQAVAPTPGAVLRPWMRVQTKPAATSPAVHTMPYRYQVSPARPLVLAQAAAQLDATATAQPVAADSIDLSFEHCIVALHWPWFPETFLLTRNWYVPGYACASFANGNGAGDTGMLPVLPSGFVVIRNLRISAKWSSDDLAAMQGSASFGPFSLVGRSFDAGSGTLCCPGMQIIGWFCDALPVLPPVGDPALAPATAALDAATPASPSADASGSATPAVATGGAIDKPVATSSSESFAPGPVLAPSAPSPVVSAATAP